MYLLVVGQGVEGMSKSETEEMIEIEIDGREETGVSRGRVSAFSVFSLPFFPCV